MKIDREVAKYKVIVLVKFNKADTILRQGNAEYNGSLKFDSTFIQNSNYVRKNKYYLVLSTLIVNKYMHLNM